jgi:hypothetical protein
MTLSSEARRSLSLTPPEALSAAPKSFIFYFRYGTAAIISGHGVTENDNCYFVRSSDGQVIGTYEKSEVIGWHDTADLEGRLTVGPESTEENADEEEWRED